VSAFGGFDGFIVMSEAASSVGRFWRSVLVLPEVRFLFSLASGARRYIEARDIANAPQMTRTHEMTNL
jgi:hypothetical protein